MNSTEQLQLFDNFAAKLRETLVKKGADYANETDVLANFKTSSKMAKITVMSVIIVEITKKVARIVNLSKKGKIAQNEPFEDSILDLCGYAFLLLCAVTERKDKAVNDMVNANLDSRGFSMEIKSAKELEAISHEVWYNDNELAHEGSLQSCINYLRRRMNSGHRINSTFKTGEVSGVIDSFGNTFKIERIKSITEPEPPTHCVKDNEDWARFEGSYNDCLNYLTKHMMRGGFAAYEVNNEGAVIGIANDTTKEIFLISEI